jgi:hypothetical protein
MLRQGYFTKYGAKLGTVRSENATECATAGAPAFKDNGLSNTARQQS